MKVFTHNGKATPAFSVTGKGELAFVTRDVAHTLQSVRDTADMATIDLDKLRIKPRTILSNLRINETIQIGNDSGLEMEDFYRGSNRNYIRLGGKQYSAS